MKNQSNYEVFRQCGTGWKGLIEPLIEECTDLGGTVEEIKEKFGQLRFYYTCDPDANNAQEWDDFEFAVATAEHNSTRICELCGRPGTTMTSGGWLKTLCPEDAIQLGYNKQATKT